MSRKPKVEHKYHPKKDRLEIAVKHYALQKKAEREKLILKFLKVLERSPALIVANAKASGKKNAAKAPKKESKLPMIGD